MLQGHWYSISDLDAEDTTPFAYFIALSDALDFRDSCYHNSPLHRFEMREHRFGKEEPE